MPTILQSSAASAPLPSSPYIYSIVPDANGVHCIASDDALRSYSRETLQPISETKNVHDGVTCLKSWDGGDSGRRSIFITAGRDGKVRIWDSRVGAGTSVTELESQKNAPISALACQESQNAIAAGAEVEISGREADIFIWDIRNTSRPSRNYAESHTDTISILSFAPQTSRSPGLALPPTTFLSGGTDALLTLFDITHADEDDAVIQVFNHGAALHKAGILAGQVWATSSDESLSFYEIADPNAVGKEETGVQVVGDVREMLECRYVVDVVQGSIVVGDSTSDLEEPTTSTNDVDYNSRGHLAAYPLVQSPAGWSVNRDQLLIFNGAHGEEIVRDLAFDGQNSTYYTCGEDGFVKAWKAG
ncbi:MAG: hypothetical protein M1820_005800 [Bogoriella megaspora]|nr:MAG: hypothetical protein M1820_005800 [Bogoriella megaspora]